MGFSDVVDRIKDILNKGPDDWEARLAASCEMISPSGKTFSPKWRGNERSKAKKLGVFSYPKLRGEIVQDLEVNATRYPLTLYFDGKDHDKTAAEFFSATDETGPWTVTHPVHGFLELQLVQIREQIQPITSGGITVFETDWIEPLDPELLLTARELKSKTEAAVDDLNISAAQQFANNVTQRATAYTNAIASAADGVSAVLDAATSPLFETLDALNSMVNATQLALNDTTTQLSIITDSLSGQIQRLAQLPAFGIGSGQEKLSRFEDAADTVASRLPLSGSLPAAADPEIERNQAATYELTLTGIMGALANVATVSELTTRAQAVELAESIGDQFKSIIDNLELTQQAFEDQPVDFQFFSQSETFLDALRAITLASQYLLALAPSLKIEQRSTLDRPRSPVEIVATKYGTLGDNYELLDEFIAANDLNDTQDGNQILIIDRGVEIVTYA